MTTPYDRDPDALAWARQRVTKQLDFIEEMAAHLDNKGGTTRAEGYRAAAGRLRSMLIGGAGCVVAAFDERLPASLAAIDNAR